MGGREGKGKGEGRGGRERKREERGAERPPPTAFWTDRTLGE